MLQPPSDLTVPDVGSTTLRGVLGAYLRQNLSDLMRLPMGRFPAHLFDDFADVRAVLERLLRAKNAGLVYSITRRVTHSTLVQCLHRELWGRGDVALLDAWLCELTALSALELSAAGELPTQGLSLHGRPARLVSIGLNLAIEATPDWSFGFLPGRLVLLKGEQRAEVDLHDLASARLPDGVVASRPYHVIDGELRLALVDNNPLSGEEAHPDKLGNALDLGGQPLDAWLGTLGRALSLVQERLPELGAELRLCMQTLVPVGYDAQKHLSASYGEAIGTAYLTLHPDLMTMTEALIHEFSHNKINALSRLEPLLHNAFSPLVSSPVRPDPRPLHGVLLAVHAFVPVARLYEQMLLADHELSRSPTFAARYRQLVGKNREGTATLVTHAEPTDMGRAVLDELRRWDAHFAAVETPNQNEAWP